jgi:hypothetical protein
MRVELLGFGVAVIAHAACGGVGDSGLFGDAGAQADVGTKVEKDGAPKGTTMPGSDATGEDVGTVAMPDGHVVTPIPDTGTPMPDASNPIPDATIPVDTGPPAATIQCLNGPCSGAAAVCCVTASEQGESGACVAAASDCTGEGKVPITCEAASDCTSSQICCAATIDYGGQVYPTSITCQSTCNGQNESPLCEVGGANTCTTQGQTCVGFQGTPYGTCQYENGAGEGG